MTGELERVWKEAAVAYSLYCLAFAATEENIKNFRIAGAPA
jgi:hypothetical protein